MATVDPATEALQNFLGCDVFFAACWVSQDIEEILRDLIYTS